MKGFLLIIAFLASNSYASNNKFLKCLGQEELYYHQQGKTPGAVQKLTEKLISEFIQISDTLTIKSRFQSEICNSNSKTPPSLVLLQLILTHKEKIFITKAPKDSVKQRSMDQRMMKEITLNGFNAFKTYINQLQAQAKKPNCIINKIPALKDFYFKTRYTLENQGIRKLILEIKNIDAVFKKLNNKNILDKC